MQDKTDVHSRQANFFQICQRCPHKDCCVGTRPPLSLRRQAIIEDYLKTQGLAVNNLFDRDGAHTFPGEAEGNRCGFLDENTEKCRVHSVKPETCVAGPVTFDIKAETGKIEWYLKKETICPLAGALAQNKTELQSHLESARRELLRLVEDLDAEALQTILKIEEPDTFKIGEEDVHAAVLAKLKPSAQQSSQM